MGITMSTGRFARRGKAAERLRLEEYEFYPFAVTEGGHIEFSSTAFQTAVDYFCSHHNPLAARELIVIGEQNLVRDTFGSRELERYKTLFSKYHGGAKRKSAVRPAMPGCQAISWQAYFIPRAFIICRTSREKAPVWFSSSAVCTVRLR